jgi:Zn-finger protein
MIIIIILCCIIFLYIYMKNNTTKKIIYRTDIRNIKNHVNIYITHTKEKYILEQILQIIIILL